MTITNETILQQVRDSHTAGTPTPELIESVSIMMDHLLSKHSFSQFQAQGFIDISLAKSRIFDEDPQGNWCLWKSYDESKSKMAMTYFHMMIYAEFLRQINSNKFPKICQV